LPICTSNHLALSYLQWQLLLEPPTSPSSKITVYTTTHILPILLPALISLSHAIENGGGHDISPPTPDLGTREQSTELKVFFARNLAKPIAKAIEDCYEKQPNDPGDHMAKFFFDRSSDEPLNPEFDDQGESDCNGVQYLCAHPQI